MTESLVFQVELTMHIVFGLLFLALAAITMSGLPKTLAALESNRKNGGKVWYAVSWGIIAFSAVHAVFLFFTVLVTGLDVLFSLIMNEQGRTLADMWPFGSDILLRLSAVLVLIMLSLNAALRCYSYGLQRMERQDATPPPKHSGF